MFQRKLYPNLTVCNFHFMSSKLFCVSTLWVLAQCNPRTEMHAGYFLCCPLVSHVKYAPRAILRLEKDGTDRQTDGLRTDGLYEWYITPTIRRGHHNNVNMYSASSAKHLMRRTVLWENAYWLSTTSRAVDGDCFSIEFHVIGPTAPKTWRP